MEMIEKRNRGTYFTDRQKYVEGTCTMFMQPIRDFGEIRYGHSYSTDEEFVKISDTIGSSCFLDVTALTKAEIAKELCKVILLDQTKVAPESVITSIEELRRIAPLFR